MYSVFRTILDINHHEDPMRSRAIFDDMGIVFEWR
jgi:hypothetical protein